jgi:anti-sigma factor RsiW
MTCREARDRLSDYLDNLLPGTARQRLAQHLAACADCAEEYRLLAATCRLLSTYGTQPCPVDLTDLATRLPARTRRPWFSLVLLRRLAAATALAAAAVFGWQSWYRTPEGPIAPPRAPRRVVVREVAEVEELHQSFTIQQSLSGQDGLVVFAPEWAERGQ